MYSSVPCYGIMSICVVIAVRNIKFIKVAVLTVRAVICDF
jgi:hypothetical protein